MTYLSKSRRGRHVCLYDRQAVPGFILPPEILSDVTVVFMHDRPLSLAQLYLREALSPEEVRLLLDDMVAVVHRIEDDKYLNNL